MPLFRGSSRFEGLILSHHFRFNVTCKCNKEEIDDDDNDDGDDDLIRGNLFFFSLTSKKNTTQFILTSNIKTFV